MSERCTRVAADGEPCKAWAVSGSDPPTCSAHLGTAHRRTALSEEITQLLVSLLRAGNAVNVACSSVGLPISTFYMWLDRGNPELKASADAPYRAFRVAISRARDEGEARNVATIALAAKKDWRAAAWLLERQQPERWARGAAARAGGTVDEHEQTGAQGADDGDPFTALEGDQLAERRARRRGSQAADA